MEGWGSFVMQEKLKMIKVALRDWHLNHTQNLVGKITHVKDRISVFNEKGEVSVLADEEVEELHGLYEELHSLSQINASICWQQSRLLWLREGDANSKKNHGKMSSRRRVNTITTIQVEGVSVEGVHNVWKAIFTHFSNHFKAPNVVRPTV